MAQPEMPEGQHSKKYQWRLIRGSAARRFGTAVALIGILWAAVEIVAIMLFVAPMNTALRHSVVGTALLVAAAAGATGALAGFLFGVPRILSASSDTQAVLGERVGSNTNLEQISDWLTKVLVGVGLTQIGQLSSAIGRLGATLKTPYGDQPASATFAVASIFYSFIVAFILNYMWTRTRFLTVLMKLESRAGRSPSPKAEQVVQAPLANSAPASEPSQPVK